MTKIKYTKDGKKVVVIGQINKTEFICKEIYVDENGNEIPLGESFTSTNLLDYPAVTWVEKEIKRLEEVLKKKKDTLSEINEVEKRHKKHLKTWNKWIDNFEKIFGKEFDKKNAAALCKKIKDLLSPSGYVVIYDYKMQLMTKKEFIEKKSLSHFENITMFSLAVKRTANRSVGEFSYYRHQYSDDSGGKYKVNFFKTKEEALQSIQDKLDVKTKINTAHFNIAKEHGLEIRKELLDDYFEEQERNLKKDRNYYYELVSKKKEAIEALEIERYNWANKKNKDEV